MTDDVIAVNRVLPMPNPNRKIPLSPKQKALIEELRYRMVALKREKLKRHYRTNFFAFCRWAMDNDWVEEDVHKPLCDLLQDIYYGKIKPKAAKNLVRAMIQAWRGSLKSTIITCYWVMWILLQNDPPDLKTSDWEPPKSFNGKPGYDQRFLLGQEIDKNVIKYHKLIQENFEKNVTLRALFGDLAPAKRSAGLWTAFQSNVTWRRDIRAKEANITCCSLEGSINSGHYDIGIFDDLYSDKQVTTREQMDRVKLFYGLLNPIMEIKKKEADAAEDRSGAILICSGVRWDDGDQFGDIERDQSHLWLIWKLPVYRDVVIDGVDQRIYACASRFGEEVIEELKATMTPDDFAKHYLLDPINSETAIFRPDFFSDSTLFTMPSDPLHRKEFLKDMTTFVLCDPAISKEKAACHAAILTVGVDKRGHFWILDVFRKKGVQPTDFINESIRQWSEWSAVYIAIEEDGLGKVYLPFMNLMASQGSPMPPTWPLKTGGRSKEYRIRGLEPYARAKRIHFQKMNPVHFECINEFIRFPKGTYQDAIDALSYMTDLVRVPVERIKEEIREARAGVPDKDLRELHENMLIELGIKPGHRKLRPWYDL